MFCAYLQDAHGNQFGQMVQDKSQDIQLIVGYEYQGTTVIRFKRKINTCDGEDLALTVRTTDIKSNLPIEIYGKNNFVHRFY